MLDSHWAPVLLRLGLAVPAVYAAARHDRVKFNAWRERNRRWRKEGRTPPPEYGRDNRLWRIRLSALALCAAALLSTFWATFSRPIHFAAIILLYVIALIGASTWGILSEHVR
jgi:hypothetical protein